MAPFPLFLAGIPKDRLHAVDLRAFDEKVQGHCSEFLISGQRPVAAFEKAPEPLKRAEDQVEDEKAQKTEEPGRVKDVGEAGCAEEGVHPLPMPPPILNECGLRNERADNAGQRDQAEERDGELDG